MTFVCKVTSKTDSGGEFLVVQDEEKKPLISINCSNNTYVFSYGNQASKEFYTATAEKRETGIMVFLEIKVKKGSFIPYFKPNPIIGDDYRPNIYTKPTTRSRCNSAMK